MECYSFVLSRSINIFCGFLKLAIHEVSESFFDVVKKFIQVILGFIKDVVDFEFLVISFCELSCSNICKLAFQLMVDVEVSSNCALKIVLLHAGVVALDDLYHFSAIRVEFVVALRCLRSISRP